MRVKSYFLNTYLILISLFLTLIILEIVCRIFVNFDSGYYSSSKKNFDKSSIIHPYGKIPINSLGFFDGEFELKKEKQVIAYFGDSVTYGVGAGYPYRFTEYLDELNPKFEHINLSGGIGTSLNEWSNEKEKYLLDKNIIRLIYVMNLNDIAPLAKQLSQNNISSSSVKNLNVLRKFIIPLDNIFRGNSELYTFVRFIIKEQFVKAGYEASGYESIELFPKKNLQHIIAASKVLDEWLEKTQKQGFKSCVVILPYEMQISKDAANYYRSINIKFEDEFVNFSTQNLIKKNLKNYKKFYIINDERFSEKKIGSYFVFDKGDKIDFNHPNRKGHLIIAREIDKKKICQN